MTSDQVLGAARRRLRPSRWGALALFLGLALLLRLSLGTLWVPFDPRLAVAATSLLAGAYLLGPMAWQWTGNEDPRAGLLRGSVQAILWNLFWLFLVAHIVVLLLHPQGAPPPRPPGPRPPHWTPIVFLHLPLAFLTGWFVAEKEAAELERAASETARRASEDAAREARILALQAQLDPHVLYNALGGMAELVHRSPREAEEALLDLADLYRTLGSLGRHASIPLREERALLEQYLAIEGLRLGPRLQVEWTWAPGLEDFPVPPLLLQPLAENAIKHGLAPSESGGCLRLSAALEGKELRLEVENTGLPLETKEEGTGLANLRARLRLAGKGARLSLERRGEWTVAELRLPLEEP